MLFFNLDEPSTIDDDDEEFSLSEGESRAKRRAQNKNRKKQNTKKNAANSGKQLHTNKRPNIPVAALNNSTASQNKATGSSTFPSRNMMNTPNVSAIGTSFPAPASISGGSASVYGYGGLPIAPPPNGNANFLATNSHIPPAQRAGPYIPYFPQPCKPS